MIWISQRICPNSGVPPIGVFSSVGDYKTWRESTYRDVSWLSRKWSSDDTDFVKSDLNAVVGEVKPRQVEDVLSVIQEILDYAVIGWNIL